VSATAVSYPLVMALKEADKILGPDRQWEPVNEAQRRFLKDFFEPCRGEAVPEIQSLASWDAQEINSFLAQRGFNLRVGPFPADHFGAASVLDLLVEWVSPGSVITIKSGLLRRRSYPGVHLRAGLMFLRAAGHWGAIARISTKTGTDVYMTMLRSPRPSLDLVALAEELTAKARRTERYLGAKFPMVCLDHFVDVSWIEGVRATAESGVPTIVDKALQQTRLRMNERGARAESAVALVPLTASRWPARPRPPLVINRPFLIWFVRKGLAKPLFVGHITREDWKNPGDITEAA
jgi:hypothetical protein